MNAKAATALSGLVLVALVAPLPAAAASHLDYRAPAECPSESDFLGAVAARGGSLSASSDQADRVLDVTIDPDDHGFHGALQVIHGSDRSDRREVHGASCGEVADALAVVTAIALRPSEPNSPAVPDPKPDSSNQTKAPAVAPNVSVLQTWPVPFHPGSQAVEVDAGTLRLDSVTNLTAFGGVAIGVIPRVAMPRYDLSLSRQNYISLPGGDSYGVGPIWRLRLSFLGDGVYRSHGTTTDVTGQAIGMGPCYAPFFDTDGLELMLCLELAIEVLNARTKNAAGAVTQSKNTGLGTLGFGTELTYNLGRHVQIALKLGADAATSPISAERPDGGSIFRSSWPSAHAMLGVGAHW